LEDRPEQHNLSFVGKLKQHCPSLYFSLSTWERDQLDSTFLSDLVTSPVGFLGKDFEIEPMVTVPLAGRVETSNVLLPDSEPETVEEPSCSPLVGTSLVPGFREPDYGDISLDRVLTSLVPSFREATSPIPLPTYLGKEVTHRAESSGDFGVTNCEGEETGKGFAWSRGLGYEFSPIKTRSARKKAGINSTFFAQHLSTNTDLGVLRGMKALARAKS
jgi:hypothetical protein